MLSAVVRRSASSARAVVGRRSFHGSRASLMADADPAKGGGFKWQHLVTPYSDPSFSTRMRSIEQTLQQMRAELAGVPERIEPINWAEWEEKLDDKAAVGNIKSSYDSLKVAEAERTADVAEFGAELDRAIGKAGESEAAVAELLQHYKTELAAAQKEKKDIHGWHFHDYLARYPGLAEQMRAEYMEGYQLPPEALERLTDSDLSELRRTVRNGGRISSDEDIPTKVGAFDYEAELRSTEELARKVLGADSPQMRDVQQLISKEQAAVKELGATHEEEHH